MGLGFFLTTPPSTYSLTRTSSGCVVEKLSRFVGVVCLSTLVDDREESLDKRHLGSSKCELDFHTLAVQPEREESAWEGMAVVEGRE